MIAAQELRIGNLFNLIDRSREVHLPMQAFCEIVELKLFKVSFVVLPSKPIYEIENLQEASYADISPIPLSSEILDKLELNGVWIKESWMVIPDISGGELFGWAIKVRNAAHTKEIEFAYFKHLHQLQNLYFSLTGTELEVKL